MSSVTWQACENEASASHTPEVFSEVSLHLYNYLCQRDCVYGAVCETYQTDFVYKTGSSV